MSRTGAQAGLQPSPHQLVPRLCGQPGLGVDKDTARSSGEMFWMETFFIPWCPEMGWWDRGTALGPGTGRANPGGDCGWAGLWRGSCSGYWAWSRLTYSNVAEVGDGLAFVGGHHDRWCHCRTPQLQVQGVVRTGGEGCADVPRLPALVLLTPATMPFPLGPQIWVGTVTFWKTPPHPLPEHRT